MWVACRLPFIECIDRGALGIGAAVCKDKELFLLFLHLLSDEATRLLALRGRWMERSRARGDRAFYRKANVMWKEIDGFPEYAVNENGEILSRHSGKILKSRVDQRGYPVVALRHNKQRRCLSVHRVVAMAFVPNQNEYPQVNHKDENKLNNNADNLEWCTAKQNSNFGTRTARSAKNHEKPVLIHYPDGTIARCESIKMAAEKLACGVATIHRSIDLEKRTPSGALITRE